MNNNKIFDDMFNPNSNFLKNSIIKKVLSMLFNSPQDNLNFVHIAGTNGKGSTSTMIASVLMHCGYKTGLFTSPSVKSFMERIRINNVPMSFDEYKSIRNKIIDESPQIIKNEFSINKNFGEFSITVMAALNYFSKNNCQIAVLETGIGGYKDATNVINSPLVSVVTSISFDHMQTLGNTLEEIAFQKSGIIKPGIPVVVSAGQNEIIYNVMKKAAEKNSSELIIPDPNDINLISSDIDNGTIFKYKNLEMKINLLGKHQLENALTALTAIDVMKKELNIPDSAIKAGMENAFINARLEILSRNPLVILDGAHNESGIKSLSKFIRDYLQNKKLIAIIGMCKDKNSHEAFSDIMPLFSEVITVEIPRFPRTMELNELTSIVKNFNSNVKPFQDMEQAVKYAVNNCDDNSAVIIFGSLYLARRILRDDNITYERNI